MVTTGRREGHHRRVGAGPARARPALTAGLLVSLAAPSIARADDPPAPPIEVLVQGGPSPTSARDPSAASYVLREGRLHAPGLSAAEALATVPGVQVSRSGASSDPATAQVRGASSAQTPIYLAGVRLNDDITGTADLAQIPLWMVQRVEVFRGNAPADADRLGIGGAIFFEPTLPRGTRVGAGLGLGSYGALATRASASIGDARAGAMVAIERRSARNDYPFVGDLRTDDAARAPTIRTNADVIAHDLWGIGRYALRGGSITAITNGFVQDQGVSGLSPSPARAARSHVQRWLGALTAQVPCATGDEGGPRCRIELQTSAIVARRELDDPRRELGLLARRVASRGARIAEQARVKIGLGDHVSLAASVGEELETLDLERDGGQRLHALRDVTRASASAIVVPTRRLTLDALAAIEHHGTHAIDATSVLEPSGRVGASVTLPRGVTLLANLGRYARIPTLGELYGVSPVVQGNPALLPERSLSIDVGARASHATPDAQLFVELFGFARFASDLIAYQRASLDAVRPFNTRTARTLGLELAAGARLFQRLRGELALTLLDPRDTSGDLGQPSTVIPYQARVAASPAIAIEHGPIEDLALDRASLGARLTYRSSRKADPAGLYPRIEPQATLDLDLSLLFDHRRIGLDFRLANLLDARSSDVLGLPLPGRTMHAGMEVWW